MELLDHFLEAVQMKLVETVYIVPMSISSELLPNSSNSNPNCRVRISIDQPFSLRVSTWRYIRRLNFYNIYFLFKEFDDRYQSREVMVPPEEPHLEELKLLSRHILTTGSNQRIFHATQIVSFVLSYKRKRLTFAELAEEFDNVLQDIKNKSRDVSFSGPTEQWVRHAVRPDKSSKHR